MPVHTHRNDLKALHYLLNWLQKRNLELDWLRVNADSIQISVHLPKQQDPIIGYGQNFTDAVRDLLLAFRGKRYRRDRKLTVVERLLKDKERR